MAVRSARHQGLIPPRLPAMTRGMRIAPHIALRSPALCHRLRLLAAVVAAGLAPAPASAQTLIEPIPGQRAHVLPKAQSAFPGARPCPEYGSGFMRLEGGTGCVRVSGSVRAEYGVGRGAYGPSTGSASAAAGVAQIETRTPTAFGDVRTVVRGRGQINSGLPTTPVR